MDKHVEVRILQIMLWCSLLLNFVLAFFAAGGTW